eukprot:Colp12_sorted_trinity150504_noHs@26355
MSHHRSHKRRSEYDDDDRGKRRRHDDDGRERRKSDHDRRYSEHDNRWDSKEQKTEDGNFAAGTKWEKYIDAIDRIFFKKTDWISKGTEAYGEFWDFAHRYEEFLKRRGQTSNNGEGGSQVEVGRPPFDFPKQYEKRYRVNFSIVTDDVIMKAKEHASGRESRGSRVGGLEEAQLIEFRALLHSYEDFVQKQRFAKLTKIRDDRKNLPIYAFREQIIEAVREHQVILVAGDTGCGKSTQVRCCCCCCCCCC